MRAAPAVMLHEQGRALHVSDPRRFRALEDQAVEFNSRGPSDGLRCDRMDVWDLAGGLAFDA